MVTRSACYLITIYGPGSLQEFAMKTNMPIAQIRQGCECYSWDQGNFSPVINIDKISYQEYRRETARIKIERDYQCIEITQDHFLGYVSELTKSILGGN